MLTMQTRRNWVAGALATLGAAGAFAAGATVAGELERHTRAVSVGSEAALGCTPRFEAPSSADEVPRCARGA